MSYIGEMVIRGVYGPEVAISKLKSIHGHMVYFLII